MCGNAIERCAKRCLARLSTTRTTQSLVPNRWAPFERHPEDRILFPGSMKCRSGWRYRPEGSGGFLKLRMGKNIRMTEVGSQQECPVISEPFLTPRATQGPKKGLSWVWSESEKNSSELARVVRPLDFFFLCARIWTTVIGLCMNMTEYNGSIFILIFSLPISDDTLDENQRWHTARSWPLVNDLATEAEHELKHKPFFSEFRTGNTWNYT